MLGSPSPEMCTNAAGALSNLSRENVKNQTAVARTGAIAPLCTLVREGSSETKEQSASALWALAQDNAPNKSTIAKFGAIEPLLGLLDRFYLCHRYRGVFSFLLCGSPSRGGAAA